MHILVRLLTELSYTDLVLLFYDILIIFCKLDLKNPLGAFHKVLFLFYFTPGGWYELKFVYWIVSVALK